MLVEEDVVCLGGITSGVATSIVSLPMPFTLIVPAATDMPSCAVAVTEDVRSVGTDAAVR